MAQSKNKINNEVAVPSVAQQLGYWGEQQAVHLLQQAGFDIFAQNYHSRFGEIDIIALKQQEMLFVEVKARAKTQRGTAVEVITLQKQRKMLKTALFFLEKHPHLYDLHFRFDIFCFDFHQVFAKNVQHNFASYTYDQQWIENAFTLDAEFINL